MRSIQRFSEAACWLASLSYASGYKRLGRQYLADAFMSQMLVTEEAHVVMSGPLPATR